MVVKKKTKQNKTESHWMEKYDLDFLSHLLPGLVESEKP